MDKSLILNRIKLAYSLKNDAELSRFLEIKRNTLSNWYSRNTLDYDKVFLKCELLNFEWLLTGKGEMLKNPVQPILSSSQLQENDKYTTLLEENNATLKSQLKDKEEKETLLKDKIVYLEHRLALAEVKDKEEMSLKIKKQRKENKELSAQKDSIIKQQKEIINFQNEEINALKSRHLPPDEPLQPSKGV